MTWEVDEVYAWAKRAFVFAVVFQVLLALHLVGLTAYVSGLRGLVRNAPMLGLFAVLEGCVSAIIYRQLQRLRCRAIKPCEGTSA